MGVRHVATPVIDDRLGGQLISYLPKDGWMSDTDCQMHGIYADAYKCTGVRYKVDNKPLLHSISSWALVPI